MTNCDKKRIRCLYFILKAKFLSFLSCLPNSKKKCICSGVIFGSEFLFDEKRTCVIVVWIGDDDLTDPYEPFASKVFQCA